MQHLFKQERIRKITARTNVDKRPHVKGDKKKLDEKRRLLNRSFPGRWHGSRSYFVRGFSEIRQPLVI